MARRTAASLALVGLTATLSLGLVTSTAGTAMAAEPAHPRLAVPSSVVGSLDNASPADRARMVGNVIPYTITPPPTAPGAPTTGLRIPASARQGFNTAAGGAIAVGTGASIGWSVGSGVAGLFGLDSAGALQTLTGTKPKPAPSYVANGDLGAPPEPGWSDENSQIVQQISGGPGQWRYTVRIDGDEVTYGTPDGPPVIFEQQVVTEPDRFYGGQSWTVTTYCRDGGGVDRVAGSYSNADANRAGGWNVFGSGSLVVAGYSCPAGQVFERVEAILGVRDSSGAPAHTTTYYPLEHPGRAQTPSADPERFWESRYTCTQGVGGVARSEGYRESQPEWAPVPEVQCPAGDVASIELWQVVPESPELDRLIDKWAPSPGLSDWRQRFPECADGSCSLDLARVQPDGSTVSCFTTPGPCVDWWTTPEPTRTDQFRCTYAGQDLPIQECAAYAPTFNVQTGAPVQMLDGTTAPSTSVLPVADPATGAPQPRPEGYTPPQTSTPQPQPDGVLGAITRAFIPQRATLQTQTAQLRSYLEAKPPTSLLIGLTPVIGGLGQGWSGGCSALPDFSPAQDGSLRLPCAPPDQAGWFRTLLWVASAGIVVATIFGVWHMLAAGLGARSTGHGE